ncbi:Protein kinase-like domain-containing protein [Rozella allomycis CSF55]|uniref:Protein kinase-like domain-containing protein n=1 Tax=Rozella allomycis (strain CSF55) TaxID=988480 RepID=A0A075B5C7_ROZAC|nr:Protein kinase-like domain-containing protein [Rozella allomycis CSF55]|eukprot:EPZ36971.1 Protein kinase-like domain-containing protein [Rozella allomycis CSF55]
MKSIQDVSGHGSIYFWKEVRALSLLNKYPYFPDLECIYFDDDTFLVVMELLKGSAPGEKFMSCLANSRIEEECLVHGYGRNKMAQVARDIIEALKAMHQEKLINLDVKPKNMIETLDGGIKLFDFNFAMRRSDKDITFGYTRGYLPPEGVLQLKKGDWRTPKYFSYAYDVFSAGISLYNLHGLSLFRLNDTLEARFTKRWPYDISMFSIVNGTTAINYENGDFNLRKHKPEEYDKDVWDLVQKMCSIDARNRPGHTMESLNNLEAMNLFHNIKFMKQDVGNNMVDSTKSNTIDEEPNYWMITTFGCLGALTIFNVAYATYYIVRKRIAKIKSPLSVETC